MSDSQIKPEKSTVICKNCSTEFLGNYCPECGQSVKDLNRPFHFVIYDFAGTVFAFDTRLLRSLKTLLLKPGKLTADYIEGKRAQYMPPFQMYVFVSFLFFILLSFNTSRTLKESKEKSHLPVHVAANDSIVKTDTTSAIQISFNGIDTLALTRLQALADEKLLNEQSLSDEERTIFQNISRLAHEPELFFGSVFKYFSWSVFVLMPFYALLLMLFFRVKSYYYMAHLTTSLHLHVMLFLVLSVAMLLKIIFGDLHALVSLTIFLIIVLYQLLALKRLYSRKWATVAGRLVLLNTVYAFLVLGVMILVLMIAFWYF